ncbi:MAG: hypothetical protein R3E32_20660 [Chitinophagales bacterium]
MRIITYFFFLLALFSFNGIFAQTSGASLSLSAENRNIPYFNQPSYIDAFNLDIGIDKCLENSFVWYMGFRYTHSSGKHICQQCGVYNLIEGEIATKLPTKSYYSYNQVQNEVGIASGIKYYFATHKYSSIQFFAELGFIYNVFVNKKWEGAYWQNDPQTKSVIEGPFGENKRRNDMKWLDIKGMASFGAELTFADGWALIMKPYAQHHRHWEFGAILGVKRVVDNGY